MRAAGAVAILAALLAAGCGSRGGTTLESLWKRPGENVSLVPGTSDYAAGAIRVSFLVIGHDGRPVNRPEARLWLARSRKAKPFASATASGAAVFFVLAAASDLSASIRTSGEL